MLKYRLKWDEIHASVILDLELGPSLDPSTGSGGFSTGSGLMSSSESGERPSEDSLMGRMSGTGELPLADGMGPGTEGIDNGDACRRIRKGDPGVW